MYNTNEKDCNCKSHSSVQRVQQYYVCGRQRNESNAADLAAAAISITAAREKVVNFIRPFQNLGLTVIIRRPDISVNLPYSFGIFQPLDAAVWGLILLAMTVVSTPLCGSQNYH